MNSTKENTPQDDQLAGEILEGARSASRLPARLDRYGKARSRAVDMVTHLEDLEQSRRGQFNRERLALRDCGNYLLFRHYYRIAEMRLAAMHSCKKHLLCPLCALRRGAKSVEAYGDRYNVIVSERPSLRPFLVTFTVQHDLDSDLRERFQHLTASYRQLLNRRRMWLKGAKRAKYTEAAKAAGAVWSYEVIMSENGWHPHLHAIWLCEERPDKWALVEEWQRITGDSFIVDVSIDEDKAPVENFLEVFKYAMKFSNLSLADNLHAYEVLKGKRLVGSCGCFRGVVVPESNLDDQLDSEPFTELLYRYAHGLGYTLESTKDVDDGATW